MNRIRIAHALVGTALALGSGAALAQAFPVKPIRVISTFPGGGTADTMMRVVGQKAGELLGQPVIVEARPGAGGVLAAQSIVGSAPDGYNLLHAAPTTLVATPFVLKNPPYDPAKDFTFITHLTDATTCILVNTALPVNNVRELVDYARANPGKLSYGSNGIGASFHLEMEMLKLKQGIDIVHIPYKGGLDSLQAAAAGQIPVGLVTIASAYPQIKAGKVRVVALLSEKRIPGLDFPVMGEQLPDYEKIPSGSHIAGPAGIPRAVAQRLNANIARSLALPDVKEHLAKIGFLGVGNSLDEEIAQIRKDTAIMGKAIKAAKIQPE